MNNNAAALVLVPRRARRRPRGASSRAASWSRSATASASPTSSRSPARGWSRSAPPTARRSPTTSARSARAPRALLRVHQSNFRVVGFTGGAARWPSWPRSAARHGLPLVDDLGSGALLDLPDLAGEPTGREARSRPAPTVVCFSGDKLLGGPQAGVIVGARGRGRAHPPPSAGARAAHRQAVAGGARGDARALPRPAAGAARGPGAARRRPSRPRRCARAPSALAGAARRRRVVETVARVGGGALPLLELPERSRARLDGGDALAARAASRRARRAGARPRGPGAARLPHAQADATQCLA